MRFSVDVSHFDWAAQSFEGSTALPKNGWVGEARLLVLESARLLLLLHPLFVTHAKVSPLLRGSRVVGPITGLLIGDRKSM